jgi:hypothetical protein
MRNWPCEIQKLRRFSHFRCGSCPCADCGLQKPYSRRASPQQTSLDGGFRKLRPSEKREVAENATFEALHRKGDATCPRSRLLVQMAPLVEVRPICSCPRQPARKRTRVARGSSSVWVIANIRRKTAAWRDRIMICQLDWLPTSFYFALAGGTMSFIRRYSTIWP